MVINNNNNYYLSIICIKNKFIKKPSQTKSILYIYFIPTSLVCILFFKLFYLRLTYRIQNKTQLNQLTLLYPFKYGKPMHSMGFFWGATATLEQRLKCDRAEGGGELKERDLNYGLYVYSKNRTQFRFIVKATENNWRESVRSRE